MECSRVSAKSVGEMTIRFLQSYKEEQLANGTHKEEDQEQEGFNIKEGLASLLMSSLLQRCLMHRSGKECRKTTCD